MKHHFHYYVLILLIIIISIIFYIIKHLKDEEEEYYAPSLDKIVSGTVTTAKDLKGYALEKWYQLKAYLQKHYRDALIRKIFKFLNNSNLVYLGKIQDPKLNPQIKQRKTVTGQNEPTLLQSFCTRVRNNKEQSKMWLLAILKNNIYDYLFEQWKLKNTLYRAILGLGENFGFLTADEILEKFINEIINEEYDLIVERLQAFENKEGINICSGKKPSTIGKFLKKIF